MDGDGNLWVSPTPPSSDDDGGIDPPTDYELPTFHDENNESGDTDDAMHNVVSREVITGMEIYSPTYDNYPNRSGTVSSQMQLSEAAPGLYIATICTNN